MPDLRTVLVVSLRHEGGLPRELADMLDLMGWTPLRSGRAYVLDWEDAIDGPYPGVWDRIESVMEAARTCRLPHALVTVRRGEKIPVPVP